ncbi:MAG TPA: MBG domain-containing protein, partial [Verrucomicrobiae bacterium]|nr:MBG domain-containing protein [Verrucomicrobiae bacterium]
NRGGTTSTEWGAQLWLLQPGDFSLPAGGSLFANLTEANGTAHYLYTTTAMVQTGAWQHVAVTYDKTTARARLYYNGALAEDVVVGVFQPATSWDLFLGRRPAGDGTGSYAGGLDEVGIYNYALSATDLQGIYNAGASGKCNTGAPPPTQPPVLAAISDLVLRVDELTPAIRLGVTDADTSLSALRLSGVSSNPGLVPDGNILFAMAGGNWYMTVTPVFGRTGTATITVRVSDGSNETSAVFHLTVTGPPAGWARFASESAINIPTQGVATPYPATIQVDGMSGTVTNLLLSVDKFSHENVRDVNMLLVGPAGFGVVVFSHVSGNRRATNVRVHLNDQAPYDLPLDFDLWSERLRPTAYPPAVTFPSPAPAGPYAPGRLSSFNGLSANGAWSLYVYDDAAPAAGSIVGGWSLLIATSGGSSASAPTLSQIPDQVTSLNVAIGPIPITISDADTPVDQLVLSKESSNAALVPPDNIIFGGSDSNRTVTVTPAANQSGTALITVKVSDGTVETTGSFMLTVRPPNPDTNGVLTVTANDAARFYGAENPAFSGTLSGLQPGDKITATYVTSADAASPIGSYPIQPLLNDPDGKLANYLVVTNLGTLTIAPASLTARADDQTQLYGSSNLNFTGTLTGLRNGDSISLSYGTAATEDSPVGFYPITPVLSSGGALSNYTVKTQLGQLLVMPAPLTVRADDKTRMVGSANPDLTGSIEGDLNRDHLSATNSTTANFLSLPGSYPIHPTVLDPEDRLGNYRVSLYDATLTVTLLPEEPPPALALLEVRVNDQTRSVESPNPPLTGTVTGLGSGHHITVTYSTDATDRSPAGIYAITPQFTDPEDVLGLYLRIIHNGTLTVTPPSGTIRLTAVTADTSHRISGRGEASVLYTIQASSDLVDWANLGTVLSDAQGLFEFADGENPAPASRFYRVVFP